MYTVEALQDSCERVHRSMTGLLDHCGTLTDAEFVREMEGFAYPNVRLQLHHMFGAEDYWIGVLLGEPQYVEDETKYPTLRSLVDYRGAVFKKTQGYLAGASPTELNTARSMMTWGNREKALVPAHVVMRVFTHCFQHQGQIVVMTRLMGKPKGGLDFPLT